MNIAQIMARMAEINKRMAAIGTEARAEGATAELLAQLATEQDGLIAERSKLQADLIEARATAQPIVNPVAVSAPAADPVADLGASFRGMSKREKIAYSVGKQVRGKAFNETEKRALGTALTSTATTYVAATAEVDGVNNAGIFIATNVILDLLREEGKLSPILADIAFTSIPGLVEFPFRKSRDKAKAKAEGANGQDNQMEWDKLQGVKGYLQTIIAITDEVQALTDMDLGAYIIDQMLQDLNEDWVEDLIYGTGTGDHVKGLTVGAIAAVANGYEAGDDNLTAALIAGVKLCKGKYRRGAKIYVAQDVADALLFAVNANGDFKYPVFNNATGITSFGTIRMEVDENLKEGDFVIGNVRKNFKANSLIPIRLETERKARRGVTEYIASEYCATVPVPGAFVYGSKKA